MYDLFKSFIYTDQNTGEKIIKAIFCDLSGCLIKEDTPDLVLAKILKDSNLPVFLTSLVPGGIASYELYKIPYRLNIGPILPFDKISYLTDGATIAIVIDNDSNNYMSTYNPNPSNSDFYEKLSKAIEFVKQDKYKEHLYTAEEKNTQKDYLKNLFNDSIFDNSNLGSEFGGKAKTLYELANNAYKKDNYARVHFTIPKGFALSTHIFDLLYKDSYTEIKSILSKLEKYDINGINSASKQIQDIMTERQRSGIPEWLKTHIFYSYKEAVEFSYTDKVIVRSSANVEDGGRFSYAGLFKSIPNVNKSNLIDAVFEVHRSLYSAPAIPIRSY